MAETKEIKRTYNIPLRKDFHKKPDYKRSKVAIRVIKDFLKKHMKSDNIKLGKLLNEEVWKDGIKVPPHHVKVDVIKNKDGEVTAELFGHKYVSNKIEQKKESFKDRLMDKVGGPQKTIMKKAKDEDDKDKKDGKDKKDAKDDKDKKDVKDDENKKDDLKSAEKKETKVDEKKD